MHQRRRPSRQVRLRRLTALSVAGLAASAVTAACGATGQAGHGGHGREGTAAGLGHIHALGVDPADATVYIAAHHGLFKIVSTAAAERVHGRSQDTMGFTVLGPRTFVASGHPAAADIRAGAPAHLGLIRSADAGRTWSTVSESGRADFHSLQPAGSGLYAYDSQTGRVRRSTDGGRTWVQGARMRMLDLAAHRDRPEQVYATTPEGVQVSTDGGRGFSKVADAPPLTHLDALDDAELVGIDPGGRVHARRGEAGWQQAGRLGGGVDVTAFTAVDRRRLLVATADGTVHESRDGGATFAVIYKNPG